MSGEVGDEEVADADRFGPTVRVERFEATPGVDVEVVVGHGPVDQVQVEMVKAKGLEAAAEGPFHVAAFLVIVSELRGDEDLLPWDPRCANGCADFSFVVVSGRGIDMSVTDLKSVFDDTLRVGRIDSEHSEPELGDGGVGREGNGGNVSGHDSSLDLKVDTCRVPCGDPSLAATTLGESGRRRRSCSTAQAKRYSSAYIRRMLHRSRKQPVVSLRSECTGDFHRSPQQCPDRNPLCNKDEACSDGARFAHL